MSHLIEAVCAPSAWGPPPYLDAKHEDRELDERIRVDEDPKHHNEQETELQNENELELDPLKVTL